MKLVSILNNIISEVGEGTAKPYNYKGRLFRVMATVIQIAEEFMDLVDYKKNDINQLIVSPTKTKGEFDDRRAKLYMAYIKKHLPIKDIKYDGYEIVATLR
jgi:hypothetical protein